MTVNRIFTRKFADLEPQENDFRPLDREAFESLFRSHYKGLCLFAVKFVKDADASREIVQEAFLGLWEKRASINQEGQVKSYLATTVHHKCLNYLRDRKKFDERLLTAEALQPEPVFPDSDPMVAAELSDKIGEAIAGLPGKCRQVFLMNRYENLKYQEIAVKLDISLKTVEAHMSKALQHMRLKLSEFIEK